MSMYGGFNGMQDLNVQKANQACVSCRKQKRKCSKTLPACALCERMNRHCDYSDATPPPTAEDFNALRMKLMELESRLNGGNGIITSQTNFSTPSGGTLSGSEPLGPPIPGYTPQHESPWQGVQSRFPAIAFLDSHEFKYGGIAVPKPSIEIPVDVLELLGDGPSIQALLNDYFTTIHKWMPIVSQKRLTRNMASPLWEAGPDLALLLLSMKLITSRPQDGIESSHNPAYVSAKGFLALMEATGTVSLIILQAGLLITWFEYGQAIYPAAWMSAGWCVRYGNLLGINNHSEATQLIGHASTWVEQEERRRTWWGVLVTDRIVSIGSQGHILTTQEPKEDSPLPVNDDAWDDGEMSSAMYKLVSSPIDEPAGPFPRLCQASIMMGKVLKHLYGEETASENARFAASQLYLDISILSRKILEEATTSGNYLSLSSPLALTFSTLFTLCKVYSRLKASDAAPSGSPSAESLAMQAQAVDGLKTVSRSVVDFVEQINAATSSPPARDRVSPIIMDALYKAANNYAWLVRESGDEASQMALESIRHCLRRLGARWRNAAEYLRILEAQEFTYAVGSAGS